MLDMILPSKVQVETPFPVHTATLSSHSNNDVIPNKQTSSDSEEIEIQKVFYWACA